MSNACPGFTDQPGLHVECGCFELAAAFELPPPEDDCPAAETSADAYARRQATGAVARARTNAALDDLAGTIRRAEYRYRDLARGEQRLARKIAATRAAVAPK